MQDFDDFLGRDLRLFGVDDEFIGKLKWMDRFVADEIEPLDTLGFSPYDQTHPAREALFRPLQRIVRQQGLWACHLGPELGGAGFGQFKLALMNIILGRSKMASKIFGTAAPDTGNTEILAHFGTEAQKRMYLDDLVEDRITSCYSMTEPQGGADPTQFTCAAVQDGDHWVIDGEKLWSSSAKYASFFIVMAVTDPAAQRHRRLSMFIVPAETAGVEIVRSVGLGTAEIDLHDPERGLPGGDHAYMRYTNVRIPLDHLLGGRGDGFLVAQTRLSGGRIHYGMRTIGFCKRALDMMCERAKSRTTQGSLLANKQMVQERVADAWCDLEKFKLLVLRTAWLIDQNPKDYSAVRKDIAAVKVSVPWVIDSVCVKAMRMHGGLGVSWELPLMDFVMAGHVMGLADGPSEVHKITIARQVMAGYAGSTNHHDVCFTPYNLIKKKEEALKKVAPVLKAAGVDMKWVTRGLGLNSML